MLFILRAAFWIAVVSAFTPPSFRMQDDGGLTNSVLALVGEPGHDAIADVIYASEHSQSEFCRDNGDICMVGAQLGSFLGFIGDLAVDRAEDWAAAQVASNTVSATDA